MLDHSHTTATAAKQVLVVDDSATVRRVIRRYLESQFQFEIREAADGDDCIEKAKLLRPDLILLDLAMPGLNGVEAAAMLKDMMPRVPIVMFTMYDNLVCKWLADAVGVSVVLAKPNGIVQLAQSVKTLLGE